MELECRSSKLIAIDEREPLMPKEYPPASTVYYYFRKWRNDGSWKRIHDLLAQWVRVTEDRNPSPSAASLD